MFPYIAMLLAGMGAFMIGFKILSENVEKIANKGLKGLFNKSTKNKVVGAGVGAVTTALVQSSAATTVMVIGLVNAGVMTLYQAASVIIGANIGTTITAQIVALSSFDFGMYAMLLTLIGIFINMISKKEKLKTIGFILGGLGLLFLGLKCMSSSLSEITSSSSKVQELLSSINNPLLLLLIGLIFTALVQSSAAITTIIISMAAAGITIGSGGNSVLYVILGTNIGTCVTALISSIGANRNAKRASLIHLMFNVFGSVIFMIILLCWKGFMDATFAKWFSHAETQIAMFHTFFNVICALIFLPMTSILVKLSGLIVRDRKPKKEMLVNIDERMLEYPSVALGQITKEISKMGFEAIKALDLSIEDFLKQEDNNSEEIDKQNERLDLIHQEIVAFLVKISSSKVTYEEESIISTYHYNLNDILRIGEIADNIKKYTKTSIKENLHFSDAVKEDIEKMKELIDQMFSLTDMTFNSRKRDLLNQIDNIEDQIDNMRANMVSAHMERLKEGICQPESSGVFINLVNNLERAADHLTYIAQSI